MIDDFEDGDLQLPLRGGRNGAWILGWDGTGAVTAEVSTRCAARGTRAGHFSGSGFTDWGSNWTAVLRRTVADAAQPYDGRSYRGFSLWIAAGPEMTPPFEVPLGVTTMDVAWNGGICTQCMDYYRTVVQVGLAWQRVEVRFDSLAQAGWGDQFPMRRDQLVGIIIWPLKAFDLWIDDLRFEP